jgi:hypothetical protein
MTTYKRFIDQIETETREEGQQALDELETFKQHFGKQREDILGRDPRSPSEVIEWMRGVESGPAESSIPEPCLIENFFKHQQTLPPSRRSNSCMISCPCRRCSPRM